MGRENSYLNDENINEKVVEFRNELIAHRDYEDEFFYPKLEVELDDSIKLHRLLEAIAINPGMYLNYQSLAQQFDMDRRTIQQYIMWLKESFLIRLLGNYRRGTATLRKTKRAYLLDTGIISAFKPTIDDSFLGRMVKNAVINVLDAEAFWRNRREVDAVVEKIPVEVKYQEKIIRSDLKGVTEFMMKFNVRKGFVITKNREETIQVEHGSIVLIPAWKLLLDPEMIKGNL